jgi:hypothetical protein
VPFHNHNFSSCSVFYHYYLFIFSFSFLFILIIYILLYIFIFLFKYFLFVYFDRSVNKYSISYSCMYMKRKTKTGQTCFLNNWLFWGKKKLCLTNSRTSACTGKTYSWHGCYTYCANKTYGNRQFYFHLYRLWDWSALPIFRIVIGLCYVNKGSSYHPRTIVVACKRRLIKTLLSTRRARNMKYSHHLNLKLYTSPKHLLRNQYQNNQSDSNNTF